MIAIDLGVDSLLLVLLCWAGLITLALWGMSALFPRKARPTELSGPGLSPHEILERRYARGELTYTQYQLMKRDLEQD